jgi:hypothetical protein
MRETTKVHMPIQVRQDKNSIPLDWEKENRAYKTEALLGKGGHEMWTI